LALLFAVDPEGVREGVLNLLRRSASDRASNHTRANCEGARLARQAGGTKAANDTSGSWDNSPNPCPDVAPNFLTPRTLIALRPEDVLVRHFLVAEDMAIAHFAGLRPSVYGRRCLLSTKNFFVRELSHVTDLPTQCQSILADPWGSGKPCSLRAARAPAPAVLARWERQLLAVARAARLAAVAGALEAQRQA
jgi:hypothetical protein